MNRRIFLSSRYSRRVELNKYAQHLRELGYTVDCRWLTGEHETHADAVKAKPTPEQDAFKKLCGEHDVEDLRAADTVVVFTDPPGVHGPRGRGGFNVEFGMAIALGKRVFVVGHRVNVFHHLPAVVFCRSWPVAAGILWDCAHGGSLTGDQRGGSSPSAPTDAARLDGKRFCDTEAHDSGYQALAVDCPDCLQARVRSLEGDVKAWRREASDYSKLAAKYLGGRDQAQQAHRLVMSANAELQGENNRLRQKGAEHLMERDALQAVINRFHRRMQHPKSLAECPSSICEGLNAASGYGGHPAIEPAPACPGSGVAECSQCRRVKNVHCVGCPQAPSRKEAP